MTTATYTLQSNQIALSTLTSLTSESASTDRYNQALILVVILAFALVFIMFGLKRYASAKHP